MMPLQESYLHLRMGQTHFALPAAQVIEILTEFLCAEKPGGKPWIYGVLYDRRQLMPVLCPGVQDAPPPIAVVCKTGRGPTAFFAAEVEELFEVTELPDPLPVQAAPAPGGPLWPYLLRGETPIYLPENKIWGKPSDSTDG